MGAARSPVGVASAGRQERQDTRCALCTCPVDLDTEAVVWVPAVDTPVHGECLEVMLLVMARQSA